MRQCIAEMDLTGVEVVDEDEREQYPDPGKHYFDLALDYSWDAPAPAGEGISARDVREQIFLPDRDYSLQAVEKPTEQAPTPAFRALLEQFISERWLPAAASEVNGAVSNLAGLRFPGDLRQGERQRVLRRPPPVGEGAGRHLWDLRHHL